MLNKTMKVKQVFRKPKKGSDAVFYNTLRSGFVSAFAMSYNFHLPLILSPNDVWLVFLQGFRLH